VALGFFAARFTGMNPGVAQAPGLSPSGEVYSTVRSIQPDDAGRVRIAFDETRRREVSGRMDDQGIQKLLLAAAHESNPAMRVQSVGLLKEQAGSSEVRDALLNALLHDSNAGVRMKALEGLKPLAGDPEVRKALAGALLSDDNPAVRMQAVDLLVTHRDDAMVGVLQGLVQRENNVAKALSFQARVLVMDEPTAALTTVEVERLFEVIRTLRARGAAVLFISHRLEEAFACCQRVTIMRDGRFTRSALIEDVTVDDIIRSMVGRDLDAMFPKTTTEPGEVVLDVAHLGHDGVFNDITFQVRRGEIVALAGLVGAGRSEVVRAIFGIDKRTSGTVRGRGAELPNGQPLAAMKAGVALVPEDRRQQGLVMDLSIDRNMALASLGRLRQFGLIRPSSERELAITWAERLQLKFSRLRDAVSTLSGGNQQKAVLGKWLARSPSLLIIDESTRGIDVGTKAEVHRLLDKLVAEGLAVLMVSSELPEVLGVADRVLVLREGRITAEFTRTEADEDAIMRAATGQIRPAA